MAELQFETTSSVTGGVSDIIVSPDMTEDPSSVTVGSGSEKSEVNNEPSGIIMSGNNISNNFQNEDISSRFSKSTDGNCQIEASELDRSTTDEMDRKNWKNKQLAQDDSSNTNAKTDQDNNVKDSSGANSTMESNASNLSDDDNFKQKKKRKGISFPKDTFISSYFEPPDPWKNASPWTTDDLIAAYKKSCETHGSKPIVKILQQLHTVSTPGKREESFILKGEKLDHKQVECIEEILRRVQFQLVDLEGSHLDDECAVALFDMIEYYESACQLNISSNRNIGARGWQACSRLVRRTPTLNYLDMRNCDLNERTIPIFGRALKMGCHLTILHMENMSLSGRSLIILVAALKMNETLQELFLAENKLMPTDGVQLGNLMRYNHKLNLLDLRKNLLSDVGVSHLCEGLVEQNLSCGLRTLVMWNNQITYQAMPSLGRVLAASQSLETMNIGHNNITNEGIHLLKNGLLKTTSLLRIGLQGTGVSDEGAVALAEFIADSTMLLRIDLRDNEIKTGGLMALSHAMRVNSTVTRIDLDKDTKKESVIKDYAEQQSRLLRDILTFQQRNIQTAAEKEDQERAELERLAMVAAEARENKEIEVSHIGSFTVISEEIMQTEADQSEMPSVSDAMKISNSENDEASVTEDCLSTPPPFTVNDGDQNSTFHQRPKLLFSQKRLQPQESLDSPQPAPSIGDIQSKDVQSEKTTGATNRHHPDLPLVMLEQKQLCTNTPAEMLLSPQYYPKQLARKIFSVTQVNEDACSSASLSSDLCHSGFDPLNVTEIQYNSSSSTEPLLTFPKPNSSCLTPVSSGSSENAHHCSVISPTSLVRDMADETVKQIVSIDEIHLSKGTTSATHLACLSPEIIVCKEDSSSHSDSNRLSSLDDCSSLKSGEIICDPEMPFKETHSISVNNSEENPETQVSDLPSNKELISLKESSHLDMSGENINSMVSDEPLNIVPSVMSGFDESCQNNGIYIANTNSVFESEHIVNSQSEHCKASICDSSMSLNASDGDSKCVQPSEISLRNTSLLMPNINSSKEGDWDKAENETNRLPSVSNNHQLGRKSVLSDDRGAIETSSEKENSASNFTTPEALTKSESQSSFSEIESVLDIENVDLSLEEEPWTSVDGDDSKGETGKQPDFFTTLSMNGLTQELASALTSLDGSSLDDDADLKPHDEFERELDAMLADV